MNWLKIAGIAVIVLGIVLIVAWLALPSTYALVGFFRDSNHRLGFGSLMIRSECAYSISDTGRKRNGSELGKRPRRNGDSDR